MREVFQQELAEVQSRLVQIAELVEIAIQQATTAFRTSDVSLAEQVIENNERVEQMAFRLSGITRLEQCRRRLLLPGSDARERMAFVAAVAPWPPVHSRAST